MLRVPWVKTSAMLLDIVYINTNNADTAEKCYGQASSLASTGAKAKAPSDGDWLPLGVFAFTQADGPKSDISCRLT